MKPQFFSTPSAWRRWLARHHDQRKEVWVGCYKRHTGIAIPPLS